MQVKIITGNTLSELEDGVNSFLSSLKCDPKNVQFYLDNQSAVVEYENVCKGICCECMFWDDGGDFEARIGTCQMLDIRKRFGDNSCNHFTDRRR